MSAFSINQKFVEICLMTAVGTKAVVHGFSDQRQFFNAALI
jgi:hypothetical protein